MKTKTRSVQQIIEDQFKKWKAQKFEEKAKGPMPVVTISREPGSGGEIIAGKLSDKLSFDLFHQEVIHEMAQAANVSTTLFETLDEKGLNTLENWISSLVDDRHLWPDQYLQHLMKVVGAIGKHGRAVIVGRGANFILPPKGLFRVRVIAPMESRIRHVVEYFNVTKEQAKRRIIQTESDRRAFIRKYFHANIADPQHYDMIVNTETFTLDAATDSIVTAMNM
mgnify:CR=1 FL=1